jgi:hypothetical protein
MYFSRAETNHIRLGMNTKSIQCLANEIGIDIDSMKEKIDELKTKESIRRISLKYKRFRENK